MDRYQRILSLNDISMNDLKSLENKKVLLIGVGGVGQHVGVYLTTNGVINLTIIDFDKVEISNLNRQILLSEDDIGLYKVDVVKRELNKRNKTSHITSLNLKVDQDNINDLINGFDLVIDAVDNWKSKLIISHACYQKRIPLLHIGVSSYQGQYCLFKNKNLKDIIPMEVVNAPKEGVMGPIVGYISSLASQYALEYLMNKRKDEDILYHHDFHHLKGIKII